MRRTSRCSAGDPSFIVAMSTPRSTDPTWASMVMKALYSSWSRTGSSCATAACALRVIDLNRIRNGSASPVREASERSTVTARSARRAASGAGVASLVSPSLTKSAFGSNTAMRRSVPRMSRSRSTPRA